MGKRCRPGGPEESSRFVVDIHYRENATWQGDVLWVDENKQCSFRSALELLKLMDGALDEKERKGEQVG